MRTAALAFATLGVFASGCAQAGIPLDLALVRGEFVAGAKGTVCP